MAKIAILGATGAVGREFIKLLSSNYTSFEVDELHLFASARSAGTVIEDHVVKDIEKSDIPPVDVAFFSAGASVAKKWANAFVEKGAVVIDNSSAFRMDENVPLVVPEINPEDVKWHKGIIANPNCSTIIMLLPLYPIYKEFGVDKVVVSTYQAVSGAGWKAMKELLDQTREFLDTGSRTPNYFKHPIAFNLFSHDSEILPSLRNKEEEKMINETHKILKNDNIRVFPTCVRVPVLRAHTESIYIETVKSVEKNKVHEVLNRMPGIEILDKPEENHFPMPIEAEGKLEVFVGRIRVTEPNIVEMLVAGDQLLKGAAWNGLQIANLILGK